METQRTARVGHHPRDGNGAHGGEPAKDDGVRVLLGLEFDVVPGVLDRALRRAPHRAVTDRLAELLFARGAPGQR